MTGIQNIISRLKSGEIIEFAIENHRVNCLQYRIEDNAFVIYDENFHSVIFEDLEIENWIRNHLEGKDLLN